MLSKRSLIVLLPVLILVPLLVPSQTRRRCLLAMAALIAIALLIGIWPLVANLFTYGDPMATAATFAAKPELTYPLEGRPGYWLSLPYHLAIYNSLWGAFGIRSIDLPNVLYALYYVLCLLGIVGFIRHRSEINTSERRILMVLVFTFVLINIGVAYQNTQFWAVQGRLLLPGFAALVLLVGRGLYFVGKDILVSPRSKHITLALLLAVFIAADIYALIQFIVRVYYT
jgi:hypothetical protein